MALWLGMGAVILVVLTALLRHAFLVARARRRALEVLNARPEIRIDNLLQEAGLVDVADGDDLLRIWIALSRYYGLPCGRLRPSDRIDGVLAPWCGDADLPLIYLIPDYRSHARLLGEESVDTWIDLVLHVARCEVAAGRQLVGAVACTNCGYSLRGIDKARCPECGHACQQACAGAQRQTRASSL